jgi:sialidase-1
MEIISNWRKPLIAGMLLGLLAVSFAQADDGLWLDARLTKLPTDQLGPFVNTSSGDILCLDTQASFMSSDGGKTWSEPRPLIGTKHHNIQVSNERAVFRTRSGAIIAAFMNLSERKWTWKNELHDAPDAALPTYVMRSLDDGKTWQDVQKMHDDWSGAVRDMMQTEDGRVIFTAMKMLHDPGRHSVLTYSSTDDGQHWTASNLIDLGGKGHHGGVTEPTLTELKDGRLWMLIRTNWGEFWSGHSYDGGRFWRTLQPSGLAVSCAPGLLKRLASGRLLLVWNRPFPAGKTAWELSGGDGLWSETPVSNHREELSIALSDDDGQTWTTPVVVAHLRNSSAAGSRRWVAYPYVFELTPGHLWLTTMQGGLRAQFREADFVADQ